MNPYADFSPRELRALIRAGKMTDITAGACAGYVQANLIVLPKRFADDFAEFARKNPKPCPVLDVTEPGDPHIYRLADRADLSTDLPAYYVFENGERIGEFTDVRAYWREDMVGFLLGCSLSFETALIESGIRIRYIEEGRCSCGYRSNIPCEPAGVFSGPMVVSMRPVKPEQLALAYAVTERFPHVHGGPVFHGDPREIGIRDIYAPEWGDPPTIGEGEIPVFWGCGITPQVMVEQLKPDLAISHKAGCMFVGDIRNAELEEKLFSK